MKNSLKVSACLLVFVVVVLFNRQNTALNPFSRFTSSWLEADGISLLFLCFFC